MQNAVPDLSASNPLDKAGDAVKDAASNLPTLEGAGEKVRMSLRILRGFPCIGA